MPVWHTDVEDPYTSQQSEVLVPSEPQIGRAQAKEPNTREGGEDFGAIVLVSGPILMWPKWKQANDSVSPVPNDSNPFSTNSLL